MNQPPGYEEAVWRSDLVTRTATCSVFKPLVQQNSRFRHTMKTFLPPMHICSSTAAQQAYFATWACAPLSPQRARNVPVCSSKISGNISMHFELSARSTKPICISDTVGRWHEQQ